MKNIITFDQFLNESIAEYSFNNPNRNDTMFFDKLEKAIDKFFNGKKLYKIHDDRTMKPSGSTLYSLFNSNFRQAGFETVKEYSHFTSRSDTFWVSSNGKEHFIFSSWDNTIITDDPKFEEKYLK